MRNIQCTGKRFSKVASAIVALVAILSSTFLIQNCTSFDKQMQNIAAELNKSYPVMIDSETSLDSITVLPGRTFQYNYTMVNIQKDSIDANVFKEVMEPIILSNTLENPSLNLLRRKNVTFNHRYNDKDGILITEITVTPDMYKK